MGPGEPEGMVSFEEFSRLDIRVGRVLKAEPVPGSRKLIKTIVDVGGEERQILVGVAKWYKPEDLVGKLVVVLVNLKPKIMAGLASQGMILAAGCGDDEKPVFLTVEEPVKLGSKVC
ncbi:MAG: methionine--tRNA ligase subunit beta [Acidilobaceae archaeon]